MSWPSGQARRYPCPSGAGVRRQTVVYGLLTLQCIGLFVAAGMAFGLLSERLLGVDTTVLSLCFGGVVSVGTLFGNLSRSRFREARGVRPLPALKRLTKWFLIVYFGFMAPLLALAVVISLIDAGVAASDAAVALATMGLWYSVWLACALSPELLVRDLRRVRVDGNDA